MLKNQVFLPISYYLYVVSCICGRQVSLIYCKLCTYSTKIRYATKESHVLFIELELAYMH